MPWKRNYPRFRGRHGDWTVFDRLTHKIYPCFHVEFVNFQICEYAEREGRGRSGPVDQLPHHDRWLKHHEHLRNVGAFALQVGNWQRAPVVSRIDCLPFLWRLIGEVSYEDGWLRFKFEMIKD